MIKCESWASSTGPSFPLAVKLMMVWGDVGSDQISLICCGLKSTTVLNKQTVFSLVKISVKDCRVYGAHVPAPSNNNK